MFTLRSRIALAALVVPTALAWSPARAALDFQPESRVWVEGTSTVRSYRCSATRVNGTVTAEGAIDAVAADPDATVRRAEVTIPVQALDCANGTMNGHLRKALKAAESPTIRFRLNDVSEKATGAVRMSGTLSIAGRENPVAIDATVAQGRAGAPPREGEQAAPHDGVRRDAALADDGDHEGARPGRRRLRRPPEPVAADPRRHEAGPPGAPENPSSATETRP